MTPSVIALEHALWSAGSGLTPREVCASINMQWPERSEPDWHDVVLAVSVAWQKLKELSI